MSVWVSMLRWFRARTRSIAATALLSLTTAIVGSVAPHHDDCDETVCAAVGPHDSSAHHLGRDTSTTDRPLHCVLCHFTRIVRPLATVPHHIAPAVERNVWILVDLVPAPEFFVAAQPPLRAPPSSPSVDA